MTTTYVSEQLATDHAAALRRDAATSRLAALARCCRPSSWARAARRAGAAAARLRGSRPVGASCCA